MADARIASRRWAFAMQTICHVKSGQVLENRKHRSGMRGPSRKLPLTAAAAMHLPCHRWRTVAAKYRWRHRSAPSFPRRREFGISLKVDVPKVSDVCATTKTKAGL